MPLLYSTGLNYFTSHYEASFKKKCRYLSASDLTLIECYKLSNFAASEQCFRVALEFFQRFGVFLELEGPFVIMFLQVAVVWMLI